MTTRSDALIITYAHCVKWTQGQLDCAPWSAYALMHIAVELRYQTKLLDGTDYFVCVNGECIGTGESENEAIADAKYALMNESRKQAQGHAIAQIPAIQTE